MVDSMADSMADMSVDYLAARLAEMRVGWKVVHWVVQMADYWVAWLVV
jgi:hypothetical protein